MFSYHDAETVRIANDGSFIVNTSCTGLLSWKATAKYRPNKTVESVKISKIIHRSDVEVTFELYFKVISDVYRSFIPSKCSQVSGYANCSNFKHTMFISSLYFFCYWMRYKCRWIFICINTRAWPLPWSIPLLLMNCLCIVTSSAATVLTMLKIMCKHVTVLWVVSGLTNCKGPGKPLVRCSVYCHHQRPLTSHPGPWQGHMGHCSLSGNHFQI